MQDPADAREDLRPDPPGGPAPDPEPARGVPLRERLVWALPALALVSFLPPLGAPERGLDGSWEWALHMARLQGLRFGPELVYTYGPLGYLDTELFVPGTALALLAARLLFAATFAFTAVWVARALPLRALGRAVWVAALVLLVHVDSEVPLFLLLLALSRGEGRPEPWPLLRAGQTLVLAGLSLGKHLYLVEVLFVLGVLAAQDAARRRPPWQLIAYLAAVVVLWFASGQDVASIGPYLRNMFEVIRGYPAAMALWKRGASRVLVFLLGSLALIALVAESEWRRRRWAGAPGVVCLAGLLALAFKSGFTRHDEHTIIAASTLISACALYGPLLIGFAPRRAHVVAQAVGLCICLGAAQRPILRYHEALAFPRIRAATSRLRSLALPFSGEAARADYEAGKQRAAAACPIPPLAGSVDLLTDDVSALFAHDLDWRPRPVFQSFKAYTPPLARLNAEHMRSPRAADSVVVRLDHMDGRFPLQSDCLTWLELLQRYDVATVTSEVTVLRRSSAPRTLEVRPLSGPSQAGFDEWVEVPGIDDGPVWARIDVAASPRGKLAALLYKPAVLHLRVRRVDGREHDYRYLPTMTGLGFLLSPAIETHLQLAQLEATDWREALRGEAVAAIQLRTDDPWAFSPTIEVEFSRLSGPLGPPAPPRR
ncbi:MAG: hypothetical protein AB7N76_11430 [Planctomycetota bacterium]